MLAMVRDMAAPDPLSPSSDRPFSSGPKAWLAGWISPALFDFWATRVNRLWTWQRPLARVVARKPLAPDAVTLVLRGNRHCARLQPGQHVNVAAEIDGRRVQRCYSPSLNADGTLEISVKAVEGGRLSRHLCEAVQPGDVLELGAASGVLTLPEAGRGPYLFLAAGSGVTPLMSLLRALAARQMPVELDFMYWAQTGAELWFADELRALAARFPRFRLHLFTTRAAAAQADVAQGRLSAEILAQRLGDASRHRVYACGPVGFVAAAQGLLAGTATAFVAEAFSPVVADAGGGEGAEAGEVQVHLARQGLTLMLPRASTLLAALEEAGLRPASGCRMGICHTCACGKRSGTTQDVLTGETVHEPVSSLRLCVSRATSDLVLEL